MSEKAETTVIQHRNPRMVLRVIQSAIASKYRDLKNKFGDIWASDATKAARLDAAADLMINSRNTADVRRGAALIQQDTTPAEYESGTTTPKAGSKYSFITTLKELATRIIDAVSLNSLSPVWGAVSLRDAIHSTYDIVGITGDRFTVDINPESVQLGNRYIKLRNVQRIATRVCRILRDYPKQPESRTQTKYTYKMVNATTFDQLTRYYYKRYDYLDVTGAFQTKYASLGVYKTDRFEKGVRAYTFESGRQYYTTVNCKDVERISVTADTFYAQNLYFLPAITGTDRSNLYTRVVDTSVPPVTIDATGELFDTLWEEHVASEMCTVDNLPCDEAKVLLELAQTIVSIATRYKPILMTASPDESSAEFIAFSSELAAYRTLRNQIANRLGNAATRIHIPDTPKHTYGNLRYTYDQTTIGRVEVTDQENVRPWDTYELAHKLSRLDYLGLVKEIKMISTMTYIYPSAATIRTFATELFNPLIMLARLFTDLAALLDGFAPLEKQSEDPDAGVDTDDEGSDGGDVPEDPSIPGSGWTYIGHTLTDWTTRIRFSKSSDPKIRLGIVIWPRSDNTYVGYRLCSIGNDGKLVQFKCTQPPDQRVTVSGGRYVVQGYFGKCIYITDPFAYVANRPIDIFLGSDNPFSYTEVGDSKFNGIIPMENLYVLENGKYLEAPELKWKTLTVFDTAHNWYFVQSGPNLQRVTASTPTAGARYYELEKNKYYIQQSLFESKYVQVYAERVGPGDVPDPDYPGGGPDDPYKPDDPDNPPGGDGPVGPPTVDPDPPDPPPDVDEDEWLWRYTYNTTAIKLSTMTIRVHQNYVPEYFQVDPGDTHTATVTYNWVPRNVVEGSGTDRWVYCKQGDKVVIRRSKTADSEGYYTYCVDRIKNITPGDAIYIKIVRDEVIGFIRSYVQKPSFTEYLPTANPRGYLLKTLTGGRVQYAGSSDGILPRTASYLSLLVAVDNSKQEDNDKVAFDYIAIADAATMADTEDDDGNLITSTIPAYGYMKQYTDADNGKDIFYMINGVYVLSTLRPGSGQRYCKAFDETAGWVPQDHTGSNQYVYVMFDKNKAGVACSSQLTGSKAFIDSSTNGNLKIETYSHAQGRGLEPTADEMTKLRGSITSAECYEIGSEDPSLMLSGAMLANRAIFVRYTKQGSAFSSEDMPFIDSTSEPFKFLVVDRDPTLNRLSTDPYTEANGWYLLYGELDTGNRRTDTSKVRGSTIDGRKAIAITASLLRDYHIPYSGDYAFCIRAVSGSRATELATGASYATSATIAWTDIDQYLSYIPHTNTGDDPMSADTDKKRAGWKSRLISAITTNTTEKQGSYSPHSIFNNGSINCLSEDTDSSLQLVRDANSTSAVRTTMNSVYAANEFRKPTGSGKIVAKDYVIQPNYNGAAATAYEVELITASDMIYLVLSDAAYTQLFGTSTANGTATIPEVMVASGFKIYVKRLSALRVAIPHIAFSSYRGDYATSKFATKAPGKFKTGGSTLFPQFSPISAGKNAPYLAGSKSLFAPKKASSPTKKKVIAAQGLIPGMWGMSFVHKDATYPLRISFSGTYESQAYGSTNYRRYEVNSVPVVNVADRRITGDADGYYIDSSGSTYRAPRSSGSLKKLDGVINALFCIDVPAGRSRANSADIENLKLCYLLPYYELGSVESDANDVSISRCQPLAVTAGSKDAADNKSCWVLKNVIDKSDSGASVLYRIFGSSFIRRRKKVTTNNTTADRVVYLNLDWRYCYLIEVADPSGKVTPNKSPFKEIKWPKNARGIPTANNKGKLTWTAKNASGSKGINMIKAADFNSAKIVKRLVYDCFYSPDGTVYTILDMRHIAKQNGITSSVSADANGVTSFSGYLVIPKLPKGMSLYITRLDDYDVNHMLDEFDRTIRHASATSDGMEVPDLEWDTSDDDMETDRDADADGGDDPDDGSD